ncbi:reverse transcriptase domain-containing protein [Tanacetum coccineum]
MASPRTLREVQALNGKLTALGRFLVKSAGRSLPFFKTLKGCLNKNDFRWNTKVEAAFQELKSHLQSLPVLTVPKLGKTLILYLAAAIEAISTVLLTERGHVQKPIYFVSRALQGLEINYHNLEKTSWQNLLWLMACRLKTSSARLEREISYALRFNFRASNNEAEYEALVAGLELATQMEAWCLEVYTDSLLIANQLKGLYEAREDIMRRYLAKVQELQGHFINFTITHIPRSKNKHADALSKPASSSFAHLTKSVLVEVVPCRSIEVKAINTIEEVSDNWMDPIINYLTNEALPEDQIEEQKIRIKAP